MTDIIACVNCATKNRLPASVTGRPRCAKCHRDLPWLVDADDATFDDAVDTTLAVLVDLWAPWCGPCKMVAPGVEAASREFAGRLKVVKVNVDDAPQVSEHYRAQSIPMLLMLQGGKLVDGHIGALPAQEVVAWVADHLKN